MKTKLSLLLFLCISAPFLNAAEKPYFQQEVNYKIEVTLDDKKHAISAFETLVYTNNSPDELGFIFMHLWPNAYKNDRTALAKQLKESGALKFHWSKDIDRGYMDSLDFRVNGVPVQVIPDSAHIDICKLILPKPLLPGEKLTITTPFHVKLPKGVFSRLGHYGESYQITQWYPKPAVYDPSGWHPIPYLNQGEFYSEFGSYDVSITLPQNYVVGATGDLFNGQKELDWLAQKEAETKAFFEQRKNKRAAPDMSFPPSDSLTKTLRYFQKNVHDFAWFADKRYHVLKGEVELPISKRKVTTWAMFTDAEADLWEKSIDYVNDGIFYYSLWNGEYPYDQCTAVDGALTAGGGMEYPNVTIIGGSGNAKILQQTIVHEVGHNWFYGLLGSNERQHAWMDEGVNSYNENRYMRLKHPSNDSAKSQLKIGGLPISIGLGDLDNASLLSIAYVMNARKRLDQAVDLPASDYTEINYGAIVYEKTALLLDYLSAYLGQETFDRCMHAYFEEWHYKHPQPHDMQVVFEQTSGQRLDWFFKDLITAKAPIDYAIKSAKSLSETTQITLRNRTGNAVPVELSRMQGDSVIASTWLPGFAKDTTLSLPRLKHHDIRIDGSNSMPETYKKNNNLAGSGLFKTCEPLQLKLLFGFENPQRNTVYFAPLLGWNEYDRWMPGIALYNSLLPQKKLEYVLAPLFGTGSGTVVGMGNVRFSAYPETGPFQSIRLGIQGRRFTEDRYPVNLAYNKLTPEVNLLLRKAKARSTLRRSINLKHVFIFQDRVSIATLEPLTVVYSNAYSIKEIDYIATEKRKLNPYESKISLQQGDGFVRTSLEAKYTVSFPKSKGLELRLFAGKFLQNDPYSGVGYSFFGDNDIMYDQLYFDRTRFGSKVKQFALTEGGIKNTYSAPLATDWITTVNISSSLPIGLPIRAYADGGFTNASTHLEYAAGLSFSPIPGFFDVYFPLLMAQDLNKKNYTEKIRFRLQLNLLDPFKLAHEINE